MATTRAAAARATLGVMLERDRLERQPADAGTDAGPVPVAMRQAIDGFSEELAHIDQRLTEL